MRRARLRHVGATCGAGLTDPDAARRAAISIQECSVPIGTFIRHHARIERDRDHPTPQHILAVLGYPEAGPGSSNECVVGFDRDRLDAFLALDGSGPIHRFMVRLFRDAFARIQNSTTWRYPEAFGAIEAFEAGNYRCEWTIHAIRPRGIGHRVALKARATLDLLAVDLIVTSLRDGTVVWREPVERTTPRAASMGSWASRVEFREGHVCVPGFDTAGPCIPSHEIVSPKPHWSGLTFAKMRLPDEDVVRIRRENDRYVTGRMKVHSLQFVRDFSAVLSR